MTLKGGWAEAQMGTENPKLTLSKMWRPSPSKLPSYLIREILMNTWTSLISPLPNYLTKCQEPGHLFSRCALSVRPNLAWPHSSSPFLLSLPLGSLSMTWPLAASPLTLRLSLCLVSTALGSGGLGL